MRPYKNPLGYRQLRTWQQANEIFKLVEEIAASLPRRHPVTGQYLTDLKDQIVRSARSVVRNIEEGFVRTTTREYIQFLGYSKGSLEELLGDLEYCLKGNLGEAKAVSRASWLSRGEGKMLHNQITALEEKMGREKRLPREEQARQFLKRESARASEQEKWLSDRIKEIKENKSGH